MGKSVCHMNVSIYIWKRWTQYAIVKFSTGEGMGVETGRSPEFIGQSA